MFLLLLLTLIPDLPKIFLLVSVQVSAVAIITVAVIIAIESSVKCFSMETVHWVYLKHGNCLQTHLQGLRSPSDIHNVTGRKQPGLLVQTVVFSWAGFDL